MILFKAFLFVFNYWRFCQFPTCL